MGFYDSAEASRLVKIPVRKINRWLKGYASGEGGQRIEIPPLWTPQLPVQEGSLELGFLDLIELRFVKAFLDAGLGLQTIRRCLDHARSIIAESHPFSTQRFRTDGRTIFLDSANGQVDGALLDLKTDQYVLKRVIEQTFRDLDLDSDVVVRWRPLDGKTSIVIDPTRAFGQPIAESSGIPTAVLADAVAAEGSIEAASRIFEVPIGIVRDALNFESRLAVN